MISQPKRINQSLINDAIAPNDLTQIMDSYYKGEKDAELNREPLFSQLSEYWRGYSYGNREYWLKKKNIELPNEF